MAEEQKSGALALWATGAGVPEDKAKIAQALLETAGAASTGNGDAVYLSYSGKLDRYALGRDKTQPDPDALYVVEPKSVVEGWTCWKGGTVAEKHQWSAFERRTNAIPQHELRDHGPYGDGEGWNPMMGFSLFDIDDPAQEIKFSTTSVSGLNVVADLVKKMSLRLMNDEPEIPVIRLSSEKFKAKGQTNFKPKFVDVGWVTREEVARFIELGDDGDVDDLLSGAYLEEQAAPEPEPDHSNSEEGDRPVSTLIV